MAANAHFPNAAILRCETARSPPGGISPQGVKQSRASTKCASRVSPSGAHKWLRSSSTLRDDAAVAARARQPSVILARASDSDAPATASQIPRKVSAPSSVNESVEQATAAVAKAIADGQTRLQLDLVLPLIAPSLLDDWPGGIQQQLQAATPLVNKILRGISDGQDASPTTTVLSEEDAVMLLEAAKANVVVFPSAEVMLKLRQLGQAEKPLILVNPQWQPGQVVSDFGFGSARREAEEFLKPFVTAYALKVTRIRGSEVTLVRSYPSEWCVYVTDEEQRSLRFAGCQSERPSYRELEGFVKSAENSSVGGQLGFFDRLAKEFKFIKDSK